MKTLSPYQLKQAAIYNAVASVISRETVCTFMEFSEDAKREIARQMIHQMDEQEALGVIGEGLEAMDDSALLIVTRQESPDFYTKLYDAVADRYEIEINEAIATYYRDQWRDAEISLTTKRLIEAKRHGRWLKEAI